MNMRGCGKRILLAALCLCMVLTLLSAVAFAASNPDTYTFDISQGSIAISNGSTSGLKVSYGNNQSVDNIPLTQAITIIGSTSQYKVKVEASNATAATPAKIKLNGLNVNIASNSLLDYEKFLCPFLIASGSAVSLTLVSTNTLNAGIGYAGLHVPTGAAVMIDGSGSLTAAGGGFGAGIGGGIEYGVSGVSGVGDITIRGGTITATSGTGGAGIGGGVSGNGNGNISITGGNVTATGNVHGAGIGGGMGTSIGSISISGGFVTATGYIEGAGIGSSGGSVGDILISGGTVVAVGGTSVTGNIDMPAAGIGCGATGSVKNITITGGNVTATGALEGAGIGGVVGSVSSGNITISGGTIMASGGASGSAICGTTNITPAEAMPLSIKTSAVSLQSVKTIQGSPIMYPDSFVYSDSSAASDRYAKIAPESTVQTLSTPEEIVWDTSTFTTATWNPVYRADTYSVQLYKDGAKKGVPVSVTGASCDFASTIAAAGNGYYTFTVTAKDSSNNLSGSAASAQSPRITFGKKKGDFTIVKGGDDTTDYSYTGGVLTVKTSVPIIIKNTNPSKQTSHRIVVGTNNATVTLAGVNIKCNSEGQYPVNCKGNGGYGGTIKLLLSGTNTLTGPYYGNPTSTQFQSFAMYVSCSDIIIAAAENAATAKLTMTGGLMDDGHAIRIESGDITATGGYTYFDFHTDYPAGAEWPDLIVNGFPAIGVGAGGRITITGGNVHAVAKGGAAAIGTKCYSQSTYGGMYYSEEITGNLTTNPAHVDISGGTVYAQSYSGAVPFDTSISPKGAAIGAGHNSAAMVTISGGNITASVDLEQCAIGTTSIEMNSSVTISGGTIVTHGQEGGVSRGCIGSNSRNVKVPVIITGGNIFSYLPDYGAANGAANGSKAVTEHVFTNYGSTAAITTLPDDVPQYYGLNDVQAIKGVFYAFYPDLIKLDTPTNLAWGSGTSAGVASWNAVDNVTYYELMLYKDGTRLNYLFPLITDASYNFAGTIASNGPGSYTFTVKAWGDGTTYKDSDSATSGVYDYTAPAATVATPTFSPAAGTYTSAQSVTLSCATEGATIRYTTDNSEPTESTGTVYTSVIPISATTTIKAKAFKEGMTASEMATAAYTIDIAPATYAITFHANGGSGTMPNGTATEGVAFTLPSCGFTAPTGQQFKEWAIGSTSGTRVAAGGTHTFTADTTVYAIWEDIPVTTYTITLNLKLDGSAYTGQAITIQESGGTVYPLTGTGGAYTNTAVPNGTYTVYKDGVSTGRVVTVNGASGSVTLDFFTVSFTANGGTPAPASQIVIKNGYAAAPANMTKGTDTFGGWYSDTGFTTVWTFTTSKVTATTTLYAKWTAAPAFIAVTGLTFSGTPAVATNTNLTLSATVAPSNATNQTVVWSVANANGTGATVDSNGVFTATTAGTATVTATIANGTAQGTDYTKDFTITVTDTPVTTYLVTVNNGTGGGSYVENAPVTITANAPASGQRFKAWTGADSLTFTDGTSAASATAKFSMPAHAVTVTATYEGIPATQYTITYHANGGSGTMTNGAATEGVAFTLPSCGFTAPAGQQFKEWAIGSTSGTKAAAGGTRTFTANTTVYAIWEAVSPMPIDPAILSPASNKTITVAIGDMGTMAITVTGTIPLTYQWQQSTNGGMTWSNVGTSNASYTTSAVTMEYDGYQYRCIVSNTIGSATSPIFMLRVVKQPNIPKTGDNHMPGLWIGIALLSAVGFAVSIVLSRRKRRKETK